MRLKKGRFKRKFCTHFCGRTPFQSFQIVESMKAIIIRMIVLDCLMIYYKLSLLSETQREREMKRITRSLMHSGIHWLKFRFIWNRFI